MLSRPQNTHAENDQKNKACVSRLIDLGRVSQASLTPEPFLRSQCVGRRLILKYLGNVHWPDCTFIPLKLLYSVNKKTLLCRDEAVELVP